MPHAFVVANPLAGSAHVEALRTALAEHLAPPWTYDLHLLEAGKDPGALVQRQLEAGTDTFIAAGGDGTVRAVAAHLVGSEALLGILPEGTANVLAHDTGIPPGLAEALGLIAGPHDVLRIDAIRAGEVVAFLNLSIGLSAGIIRDTDSVHKRRFGMLAYVWSAIKNLFSVGVKDVVLTVDGQMHRLRAIEVLVANCPSLGLPELKVSTSIQPADGVLQVIAFRARNLRDYLEIGGELLLGRRRRHRHIQVLDVMRDVSIHCDEALDVQADGDLIGCTPVTARVVPGAVRLIVPRSGTGSGNTRLTY